MPQGAESDPNLEHPYWSKKRARRPAFLILNSKNRLVSGGFLLRLDQAARDEKLGDLHRVEGSALAQIVGHDPQSQTVVDRRIFTEAADIGGVFAVLS